jgi:V/A-type H+-transporting ATPase subunit I
MILPMTKVRILGPHITPPHEGDGVMLVGPEPALERRERRLLRVRRAIRAALDALGEPPGGTRASPEPRSATTAPAPELVARWARLARRVAREARALRAQRRALEEERGFLGRYRQLFGAFRALAEATASRTGSAAYQVVVPKGGGWSVARLREGLRQIVGDEFELWTHELDSGETGVLILVPAAAEERIESLFASARVKEVALPGVAEGLSPAQAIPRILERFEAIPAEIRSVEEELERLAKRHLPPLRRARAALEDDLGRMEMTERAGITGHAFVVEGWLPSRQTTVLRSTLEDRFGAVVAVEEVSREEWVGEEAPVVLRNPRLFRPFEKLVGVLPSPRYGTMDPTPFVAIFFPMFFGLVLGDAGYGVVLGAIALLVGRGAPSGGTRRSLAEIAGACAAFTVIFGLLYGELFGDLGARLFGMSALALDRQEALIPFLGLAIAIGVVHILLGLTLDVIAKARRGRRAAIGPGVTLVMVALIVLALLAALDVLPDAFFTPSVVIVLILFPVLVVVEGILGPTELLSTLGHILSYARVMAVGTASVMMAAAANRMVGAMGSAVVGTLFALLFHLVNFALGVFSPTVHALRLHFVEFFGTFYSPGGTRYEPFGHWVPGSGPPSREA